MRYKQIKWMILFIPTLTVGVWEYVRHQFLLSYISMDLGNWITPLLVYIISVTLLSRLFSMLEKIQRELDSERANKVALEAREQLAKELHDGVAQSLFLLSVKVDRLEFTTDQAKHDHEIYKIRKTVHEVNRYVRQAISHLSYSKTRTEDAPQRQSLDEKVKQIAEEVLITMDVDWNISDESLNPKEKVELLACIREAVINIQKHAHATKGWIEGKGNKEEWKVMIKDNGIGLQGEPFNNKDSYGLNIMDERAKEMNWDLHVVTENNYTTVELHKAGEMG